ncbi:MAG: hypothetical protein CFE37_09625 [Alphaproteobacteria bacterium PA4]|nr:MAG: hypothetical protein CFE37_09625 [Alphaproteobacteria bacterium PA4]
MYSQAEAHLTILDHCAGRSLRRAYLVLLLASERAGLRCEARQQVRELVIRNDAGLQFLTVELAGDALMLSLCRPALAENPGLAGDAMERFPGKVRGAPGAGEITIRLGSEMDAEDVVDWLFPAGNFSLGYGARKSA